MKRSGGTRIGRTAFWAVPAVGLVAVVVIGFAVVRRARGTGPPSVILISIDTLRADHLRCYGYERDTSPCLDALAAEGVLFSNNFSQSSWTLPSHMSLMTSMYPQVHGVETPHKGLASSAATLVKSLKSAGYETAGFVTNIFVSRRYGFGDGFDTYEVYPGPKDSPQLKAAHVTGRALEWLSRRRNEPFFLFLHYFDPHMDYAPPPPFDTMFDAQYDGAIDGRYETMQPHIKGLSPHPRTLSPRDLYHVIALYDGEIRYVDSQVARLREALESAGRLDDTLIVVTSDHGEEFNDHGSMEGHQWTLYDEITHVPLIFRFPRAEHGGWTIDALTQGIDVAPTILDWLGLEIPSTFRGRSLWPWISNDAASGEDSPAFSITKRFNLKWAVRTRTHKLIYTVDTGVNPWGVAVVPGYELYDLVADPHELDNIDPSRPALARPLRQTLDRWVRQPVLVSDTGQRNVNVELIAEELRLLETLGYVGLSKEENTITDSP